MLKGKQITKDSTITNFNIPKYELKRRYPTLKPRDIHILDQNYRTSLIRAVDKIILIKLDYIRAIISKDDAMIFSSEFLTDEFYNRLKEHVCTAIEIPFEFRVLEDICFEVRKYFDDRCNKVRIESASILPDRAEEYANFELNNDTIKLRFQLVELQSKLGDIFELFKELDEQNDYYEDFCLSESDTKEFDSIVDAYTSGFEINVDDIERIQKKLDAADKIMTIKLDSTRNELSKFNVSIDIIMLGITICTLVAGIYGMNVPNGYETDPHAIKIMGGIFGLIIFISIIFISIMRSIIKT